MFMIFRNFATMGLIAILATSIPAPLRADDAMLGTGGSAAEAPAASIAASNPALADPGGIRTSLANNGVQFGINYIGDVFGNVSGGFKRDVVYEGRLELVIDVDLEKAIGWKNGAIHLNGYQTHGTGLSRYAIGNLMPTSNIEALASTRLYEAWFEQKFLDGKLAVRAGQLGADTEFVTSTYAGVFLNGTFGWPQLAATDLPGSGPSYPLATPGIRVKTDPSETVSLLIGLFNGDPAGVRFGDAQRFNRHGVDFRLTDAPFLIGEAQLKYNSGKEATGLPGTLKVGVWNHFGRFDDQRFGTDGRSLADPLSNGNPRRRNGEIGLYGIIDQQVYRVPGEDATEGIGVFARVAASPADRNLIDFYFDGGVNFAGMVASRPDDSFGAGFAYSRISDRARNLDRDAVAFGAAGRPIRDFEAVVELTYQAQIVPGWTIQPDFQYIFHPGGHVPNTKSLAGLSPIHDAAAFGLRTIVRY